MSYARILSLAVALLSFVLSAIPSMAAGPKLPDQVFQLSADRAAKGVLTLKWRIAPGYYLYRGRLAATVNGHPVQLDTAAGVSKNDPTFGVTEIYYQFATATVPADRLPPKGSLIVSFQGCQENVICYPPVRKAVDLETLLITDVDAATSLGSAPAPQLADGFAPVTDTHLTQADAVAAVPASPPTEQSDAGQPLNLASGSLLSQLVAFLGFGLLLSLTPCIFPMIPILSGMLARAGEQLSVGRGFALSASYVVAMAAAYGLLGIFAAWSGQNLQAVLQTPTAIGVMSLAFVALALSMFGLYELQLPQSWAMRLSGGAKGSSIGGAAVLGFTSALIVGPCVTPPLAAALVFVAETGDVAKGSLALFALGLGMGLPLIVVGLLGVKILPRSGPWLVRVKHIFGFVFIALAIWMASRVMPTRLVSAAWGAFFLVFGLYALLALLRTEHRRWIQLAPAAIALLAMFYGGTLAIGAGLSTYEPLVPLARLGIVTFPGAAAENGFRVVTNETGLVRAIDLAREQGKPIMLDFSAEWCTECKVMDRTVFSQAAVRRELSDFLLVRADLTNFGREGQELMNRFGVVGPPTVVFLKADGSEIHGARLVGGADVAEFLSKVAIALRS